MRPQDFLPVELFVLIPEPPMPGLEERSEVGLEVRIEVKVGDIIQPGHAVGHLEQVVISPSRRQLVIPSLISYVDCYEARVEEILSGNWPGEALLRLKPLRLLGNYLCAEHHGSWHCGLDEYIHKLIYRERIIIESGQQVGSIHLIEDHFRTHLPVIYSEPGRARVYHIFRDNMGFVQPGDYLLLYQPL